MHDVAALPHGDEPVSGPRDARDEALIRQLTKRPKTQLNPPRMRKDGSLRAAREWMKGYHGRPEMLQYLAPRPEVLTREAA